MGNGDNASWVVAQEINARLSPSRGGSSLFIGFFRLWKQEGLLLLLRILQKKFRKCRDLLLLELARCVAKVRDASWVDNPCIKYSWTYVLMQILLLFSPNLVKILGVA